MFTRKEKDLKLGKRVKATLVSTVATVESVANGINDTMDIITGNLQEVRMEQKADTLRLYATLSAELTELGYTDDEIDEYLRS